MADRISQETAEVFVVPSTQKARISQETAEVFVVPDTQKARVSQVTVEVFILGSVVAGGGEQHQVIWLD